MSANSSTPTTMIPTLSSSHTSTSPTTTIEANNQSVCQKRQRCLEELSPAARHALLSDIDGSEPLMFDEVPTIVDDRLRTMDSILQQMTFEETATFRLACQQSPDHRLATDRSLRLQFLRAESFQPGLAAHRLTQYFDLFNKLFGSGALGKTLTMQNLSADDMEALSSGGFHFLQETDRAGRRTCLYDERSSRYRVVENMLRAIFYMVDIASRATDAQQKGLVSILNYTGADESGHAATMNDRLMMECGAFMRFVAPARFVGIHIVSDSIAVLNKVTPTFNKVLSKDMLLRMIVHRKETNAEMIEELRSSGLPVSSLVSMVRCDTENSILVAAVPQQAIQRDVVTSASYLIDRRMMLRQVIASQGLGQGALSYPGMINGNYTNFQVSYQPNPTTMARTSPMWTRMSNPPAHAAVARSLPAAQESSISQIEPGQSSRPSSLPTILYLESDSKVLSFYQCLLRKQIQIFQATTADVEHCPSRMNRTVFLGQVGFRCRHCANEAEWQKAPGSVYYPGALHMVYQVGQNLAKNHLLEGCTVVPDSIRAELLRLRSSKNRASAGKVYWQNAVAFMGLYEDELKGGGLYFRSLAGLKQIG